MSYSFKDVAGTLGATFTEVVSTEGEPIAVDFAYFDKEGVAWRVTARGHRVKTGEARRAEPGKAATAWVGSEQREDAEWRAVKVFLSELAAKTWMYEASNRGVEELALVGEEK